MKGNRAVVTAVVVIAVLILGWWLFRSSGAGSAIDLMQGFAAASKRPNDTVFSTGDVTIAGEAKPSISISPVVGSRIIWKVRVPDDGWLRVHMALKEEAWTLQGNGVLFMVLVSDGRASEQLFTQHVDPFGNPTDRKWIPVMVDLSGYAGEEVDLIFNTYAGPEGKPTDTNNDLAVWGFPEIVTR